MQNCRDAPCPENPPKWYMDPVPNLRGSRLGPSCLIGQWTSTPSAGAWRARVSASPGLQVPEGRAPAPSARPFSLRRASRAFPRPGPAQPSPLPALRPCPQSGRCGRCRLSRGRCPSHRRDAPRPRPRARFQDFGAEDVTQSRPEASLGYHGPHHGSRGEARACGPREVLEVPGFLHLLLWLHGSDTTRGKLHHALPAEPELYPGAGHQRDHAGADLLVHGGAGAHLPADRLPALQARAGPAEPELPVRVAAAGPGHGQPGGHAAHGVLLRRDYGGPRGLLLLHLLAGQPRALPAHGQLLALGRAPGRLQQLRAGPALRLCGPRALPHPAPRLPGLPRLQPAPDALPQAAAAQPLLQPAPGGGRRLALGAGPHAAGAGGQGGQGGRAGAPPASRLQGLHAGAHAPGAGERATRAAAAPLVPLVGVQLVRLLPNHLLRTHPVERHGRLQGLQWGCGRRRHLDGGPDGLRRGLRADPLGAVVGAADRGRDGPAGRPGPAHVQHPQHLALLRGPRLLQGLPPVPGAHRHFPDRLVDDQRAVRPGVRGQHLPCHHPEDRGDYHRGRQEGPRAPRPLPVPSLLRVLHGAGRGLLLGGCVHGREALSAERLPQLPLGDRAGKPRGGTREGAEPRGGWRRRRPGLIGDVGGRRTMAHVRHRPCQ